MIRTLGPNAFKKIKLCCPTLYNIRFTQLVYGEGIKKTRHLTDKEGSPLLMSWQLLRIKLWGTMERTISKAISKELVQLCLVLWAFNIRKSSSDVIISLNVLHVQLMHLSYRKIKLVCNLAKLKNVWRCFVRLNNLRPTYSE